MVLEQVLVETHVFFFREDGVVGIEAVFGEGGFIAAGADFSMLRVTWIARMPSWGGAIAYPLPWISVWKECQLDCRCAGAAVGKYLEEGFRDRGGHIRPRKP